MSLSARRRAKRRYVQGGSLETIVDIAAWAILICGVLGSFVVLLVGLLIGAWLGVAVSIAIVSASSFLTLFFRCLAEIIRLQKKIAGCEYEGKITGPVEQIVWECGNCGHRLINDHRCEFCGATIIAE